MLSNIPLTFIISVISHKVKASRKSKQRSKKKGGGGRGRAKERWWPVFARFTDCSVTYTPNCTSKSSIIYIYKYIDIYIYVYFHIPFNLISASAVCWRPQGRELIVEISINDLALRQTVSLPPNYSLHACKFFIFSFFALFSINIFFEVSTATQ